MAKKNTENSMRGVDFSSMLANEAGLGSEAVPSTSKVEQSSTTAHKKEESSKDYERFNFICSTKLVEKVRTVSRKEGFTIRALMEKAMSDFFDKYEAKNGKIKLLKSKDIEDVL